MKKNLKCIEDLNLENVYSEPDGEDILSFPETERSSYWSVSWADLMMTMFIVFVILYIYQDKSVDSKFSPNSTTVVDFRHAQKEPTISRKNSPDPPEIYREAQKVILDGFVSASQIDIVSNKAVRIAIAGDLFFDLGKADIKYRAKFQLDQIGRLLLENDLFINVVGHTDNLPSHSDRFPTNWELSTARACRVARYLIENVGVAENRFFVTGHSSLKPLKPNDSDANRSLNRRVEIILVKNTPDGSENNGYR